jgi:hypothetical protein
LYKVSGSLFNRVESRHFLGTVSYGNDLRVFNGQVPPWPEAVIAKEWGQKAAKKYGLTFYFPSDQQPDDDCPSWHERHKAIHCADCHKLIIPTDSPYLPKEICYHCHLKRESNAEIKNDQPYDEGVKMFLFKDGVYQSIGYASYFESFAIAPFIEEWVNKQKKPNSITVITLGGEVLHQVKAAMQLQIQTNLLSYEESDMQGPKRKFCHYERKVFDGREYEFETRFNEVHAATSALISSFEILDKAVSEGWEYKLYLKSGMTYRDDAFLRFIHYVHKGVASKEAINEKYGILLTEEEIDTTIKKMQKFGCLKSNGSEIMITEVGTNLVS